ncbi:hypothetical protein ACFLU5_08960 [Bacteroidota bacterium]
MKYIFIFLLLILPLCGIAQDIAPKDYGEWYEISLDPSMDGSHYVDWSSLLDAPAGKHGFIQVNGADLKFENGAGAVFWGTNITGANCFPTRQKADSIAKRLAMMGCNLLRFHHMDADWARPNIFGNRDITRRLDPEMLDRLDYFIARLKSKGIYIFLDLLVHRDFKELDGIQDPLPELGGKQVAYIDDEIIELQKEFATQLLTHKNQYTNLHYYEEPAIIASEYINESSGIIHWGGDILPEAYRKKLEDKFIKYGYEGKKLVAFRRANTLAVKEGFEGDVYESLEFLSRIEQDYYSTMEEHLRNIGVKYLLTGSNFPVNLLTYQYDNTFTDFIITNNYWDHPRVGAVGGFGRILYAPIHNTSMIENPARGSVNFLSKFIWDAMPFMVTEWNACYPNEYLLEGIPVVAAYAKLQGMDGIMQFAFGGNALGSDRLEPFANSQMPSHLANWVVAAPLFLRGDVTEAPGMVSDFIHKDEIYSLPNYSGFLDENYTLPYITKVSKSLDLNEEDQTGEYNKYHQESEGVITSETGELKLDYKKGIFTINTEKIQGATGQISDMNVSLPFLDIDVDNPWISVIAVSEDGQPLQISSHFYLTVVTPVKMSGEEYEDDRKALKEIGDLPLITQVAEGSITIKSSGKKLEVIPRTPNGKPMKKMKVKKSSEGFIIELSKGRSFVYEVVAK